jgi:hypothetical protein
VKWALWMFAEPQSMVPLKRKSRPMIGHYASVADAFNLHENNW